MFMGLISYIYWEVYEFDLLDLLGLIYWMFMGLISWIYWVDLGKNMKNEVHVLGKKKNNVLPKNNENQKINNLRCFKKFYFVICFLIF